MKTILPNFIISTTNDSFHTTPVKLGYVYSAYWFLYFGPWVSVGFIIKIFDYPDVFSFFRIGLNRNHGVFIWILLFLVSKIFQLRGSLIYIILVWFIHEGFYSWELKIFLLVSNTLYKFQCDIELLKFVRIYWLGIQNLQF